MMTSPGSLIAVTGGTGFIGRAFVREARSCGFRVRLLSRSADSSIPDVEVKEFDLASSRPVDPNALHGCQAVVHLAAYIPRDHDDPKEGEMCWQVNTAGTVRLIEAMGRAGVRYLLQTGSANAYAPGTEMPNESAPMYPVSRTFYLTSKIAQEVNAHALCKKRSIAIATARLGSVFGAGSSSVVNGIAKKLLARKPVVIENGGLFGADFLAVDDVVRAMLLLLRRGSEGSFNVGSGTRSTIAQIVAELFRLLQIPEGNARVQMRARSACPDLGFPALDIAKIRRLGYEPGELRSGLLQLVENLQHSEAEQLRHDSAGQLASVSASTLVT